MITNSGKESNLFRQEQIAEILDLNMKCWHAVDIKLIYIYACTFFDVISNRNLADSGSGCSSFRNVKTKPTISFIYSDKPGHVG